MGRRFRNANRNGTSSVELALLIGSALVVFHGQPMGKFLVPPEDAMCSIDEVGEKADGLRRNSVDALSRSRVASVERVLA